MGNMESPIKGKVILVVDDEPDVLETIEEMLNECTVHKAPDYDTGLQYLMSYTYDVVILDIMGVNGFELLKAAVSYRLPTVMLTAHALSSDYLKQSIEMGARAYIPKEKMSEIAEFLEDVLSLEHRSSLMHMFNKLGSFFNSRFGSRWMENEKTFWEQVASGKYEPKPVIFKK